MAQKTNGFDRFWKELKRRKVFKVTAMYAGTAFIILEVVDNLVNPLRLPEWTPTLVVVLLIVGFPFAIIFSWIFDITPDGLKKTESIETARKGKSQAIPVKRRLRVSDIVIGCLIVIVAILAYPKIFKRNTLEKRRSSGERISVAVMPFRNMTNDTLWNIWQDGIQVNLITSLSNNPEELQVRQTESVTNIIQSKGLTNYASITPSVARAISQMLDANVFINGNINQSGSTIRLNAQIIDSQTEDVLKSFQINGTAENILPLIDSLSVMVKNFLIISKLQKEITPDYRHFVSTNSPEAYRYFIYGKNAFYERDYITSIRLHKQALAIDTNFTLAARMISTAYYNLNLFEEAKKWCLQIYKKREQMPYQEKISINRLYSMINETPYEEIEYLKQLQEFDDQLPTTYYNLGLAYYSMYQFDKAIPEFEKALEIYNKWDSKPSWAYNYILLGAAYDKTGQYKKRGKLFKKAEQDFPDDLYLVAIHGILELLEGDTINANRYFGRCSSIFKGKSSSEADMASDLGELCFEANLLDKSEEYYRQALSLEPDNPDRMNNLAYLLIDKDRNVNEGQQLIDKALKLSPDNYNCLHTLGWGYFKEGKYQEALELLQKSWNIRREKAIYNYEAFLHLEAAKKAVANQTNN